MCLAAVAPAQDFAQIGLDVEPRAELPEGVLDLVASADEIAALPDSIPSSGARVPLDTVLFSAKESVYKAIYPLVRRFVGFEEVSLAFTDAEGRFEARFRSILAHETGRSSIAGRFAMTSEFIVTAVLAPAVTPVLT